MHDVRAAAVLGLCFAMAHIFFQRKRQTELPRPRTRTQTAKAQCEPEPAVPVEVLDSWTCSHCNFENRCLRSTLAGALECSNCRNDYIYIISPRKTAHKTLLDTKPVQVCALTWEHETRSSGTDRDLTTSQIRTPYRVGNDNLSSNFIVRVNEHSLPGTLLYKRFYESVKETSPKDITLAFHGTSVAAAKQILKNGMNPAKRINTQGDWFTLDVNYALTRSICREDHCMQWSGMQKDEEERNAKHVVVICFAVYMPKTIYIGEHIVCTSEKHSLPISVLEFPREPCATMGTS